MQWEQNNKENVVKIEAFVFYQSKEWNEKHKIIISLVFSRCCRNDNYLLVSYKKELIMLHYYIFIGFSFISDCCYQMQKLGCCQTVIDYY